MSSGIQNFFHSVNRVRIAACRRRERRRTHGGGHKDGHQGFHPCESRFLYFLVWRRSESGDRFEIGERQRIFTSVSFSTCSQCQIPYCYTYRLLYAGAAQGELPVRAREGPLGYDFGTPYQTIAARYSVGEHIVLPRKGKLHILFALLHYFPRFSSRYF